jgi:hypothetical protein
MDDGPTSPDTPSIPRQPAEEPPDLLEIPLPDADETPAQPLAETLAEKHKARRQDVHRLLSLADDAPVSEPPAEEAPEELESTEAPVETAPLPVAEQSLLEATTQKMRGLGQKTREGARRLGQRARSSWQRITRGAQPAQAEAALQEGQPPARGQDVWPRVRPFLWRGRIAPAFWTVASTLSLAVNILLIVILILLGRQLFFLKQDVVSNQLVNGLYDNFVRMDEAHIRTTITVSDTIQVKDTIPVVFDLPLQQKTMVVLTKDTPVKTTIFLNNTAVPLDLILTQGTELNIKLDMSVPVNQTIPVTLNVPINLRVPVDIPLDQTELHEPFVGLQQVVSPFRQLLGAVPDSWSEVCKGALKPVCRLLRFK